MKLVRFTTPGDSKPRVGVLEADSVIDLYATSLRNSEVWLAPTFQDLRATLLGCSWLGAYVNLCGRRKPVRHRADEVALLAPLELGSRIFAHVVNYPGHDREAKVRIPVKPFFFPKLASSVWHPGEDVPCHAVENKFDHEVELAIVIGAPGVSIRQQDAMRHVAGYMVANDLSYRELQMQTGFPELRLSYGMNWIQGKGLDGACVIGPHITTNDEVNNPHALRMTCSVGGVVQSDANTGEMAHKIPALIAEVSKCIVLHPGDVILSGAPAGGGLGTGRYLKPGDVVRAEIDGLGSLENQVVTAA